MRSGNHADASKQGDGTWVCGACGAESMDLELFEEAGALEHCLPDETDEQWTQAMVDVARSKYWMEEAAESMGSVSIAAKNTAEIIRSKWLALMEESTRRTAEIASDPVTNWVDEWSSSYRKNPRDV